MQEWKTREFSFRIILPAKMRQINGLITNSRVASISICIDGP